MALVQLRPRPRKKIRQKRKRPGDPKYASLIGKNIHWQPGKALRELGYDNVACGPDGPEAIALAEEWNRAALAHKALVDAALAAAAAGPTAVYALLEEWQQLQAEEIEPQTDQFEVQTEKFESSDGIQTPQIDVRTRWFKWLLSLIAGANDHLQKR